MKYWMIVLCIAFSISNAFSKTPKTYAIQGETTEDSATIWLMVSQELAQNGMIHAVYEFGPREKVKIFPLSIDWNYFKGFGYGKVKIPLLKGEKSAKLAYQLDKVVSKDFFDITTYTQKHKDTLDLTIGSCAMMGVGWTKIIKPGKSFPIYQQMQATNPDAMLWMGDNLYYLKHWKSAKREINANVKTRQISELANFLASCPQYSIWDDHDFGPDNSDGSFKGKFYSKTNFNNFWPNPQAIDSSQGIYYAIQYPQADIFMTDNRYNAKKGYTFWGETQMNWIQTELKKSTAPFKIIITGVQMGNKLSSYETLTSTGEYQKLVDFIKNEKIEGVIFINGDRHHTEFFKHQEAGLYPMYEFTCSPLTSYPVMPKKDSPEFNNPELLFPISKAQQFGRIKIHYDNQKGYVFYIQTIDKTGKQILEYSIEATELRFKP